MYVFLFFATTSLVNKDVYITMVGMKYTASQLNNVTAGD